MWGKSTSSKMTTRVSSYQEPISQLDFPPILPRDQMIIQLEGWILQSQNPINKQESQILCGKEQLLLSQVPSILLECSKERNYLPVCTKPGCMSHRVRT